MRIALLGATGQIGQSLAPLLSRRHELVLFSRPRQGKLTSGHLALERLNETPCDLIINALGPGAPGRMRELGGDLFATFQRLDQIGLDYLEKAPNTAYIYLSSGAVYGPQYTPPVGIDSCLSLPINQDLSGFAYPLAKVTIEARHRQRSHLKICDLRIFGYYSALIRLNDSFLLAQLTRSLCQQQSFQTHPQELIRDYIGPTELAAAVEAVIELGVPNAAFDLCSREPVSKADLLAFFAQQGLSYQIDPPGHLETIAKPALISTHLSLYQRSGLERPLSSLEVIDRELQRLRSHKSGD